MNRQNAFKRYWRWAKLPALTLAVLGAGCVVAATVSMQVAGWTLQAAGAVTAGIGSTSFIHSWWARRPWRRAPGGTLRATMPTPIVRGFEASNVGDRGKGSIDDQLDTLRGVIRDIEKRHIEAQWQVVDRFSDIKSAIRTLSLNHENAQRQIQADLESRDNNSMATAWIGILFVLLGMVMNELPNLLASVTR